MSEKLIHRETTFSPQVERRSTPIHASPVDVVTFKKEKQTEREENNRNESIKLLEEQIGFLSKTKNNLKHARNGISVFAAGAGASAIAVETYDHAAAGAILLGGLSVMAGGAAVFIEAVRLLTNKNEKRYQEAIDKLQG